MGARMFPKFESLEHTSVNHFGIQHRPIMFCCEVDQSDSSMLMYFAVDLEVLIKIKQYQADIVI